MFSPFPWKSLAASSRKSEDSNKGENANKTTVAPYALVATRSSAPARTLPKNRSPLLSRSSAKHHFRAISGICGRIIAFYSSHLVWTGLYYHSTFFFIAESPMWLLLSVRDITYYHINETFHYFAKNHRHQLPLLAISLWDPRNANPSFGSNVFPIDYIRVWISIHSSILHFYHSNVL
jgi:hypothetical protein